MLVDRDRYSAGNCSVQRTLDIVGEKWTLLILREAFYGARRFEEFQRRLGCARNLLAERLNGLVTAGVLTKAAYREPKQRERYEYRLTDKGLDLLPAIIALMHWGDTWEADPAGPPVVVAHRTCHQPVELVLRCSGDKRPVTARETEALPGPGARLADTG
jgi:DNA-binding HxlR family transcriptional regulator